MTPDLAVVELNVILAALTFLAGVSVGIVLVFVALVAFGLEIYEGPPPAGRKRRA